MFMKYLNANKLLLATLMTGSSVCVWRGLACLCAGVMVHKHARLLETQPHVINFDCESMKFE